MAGPTSSVSGLRNNTQSPVESSNARLFAPAKPTFVRLWMNRTCGYRSESITSQPSNDAASITRISNRIVCVRARIDATHR